ncbi:MAG TPA: hypothetical protein VFI11_05605 [Anaerolineales bacterium]|nr:hypothetical protein [Anaerolineales bacterium]
MRARWLALLAGWTLAGCSRPAEMPSSFDLATRLAASLTALPSPLATATLPPSQTAPPSATPSVTPSPVPSDTPTTGPSPTETLPALPPDDPRTGLDLRTPDYRDGFAARFTWGEQAHAGAVTTWEDERLKAVDTLADANAWWTTTGPNAVAADFYAEITASMGACSGRDAAGFAVRVDLSSGYALEVSCDGAYRVRKFTTGFVDVLRDWTSAEAIVQGPEAVNRLGFMAQGANLYVFANNLRLGEVIKDTSRFAGSFGLYAMAFDTPGLAVYFDDFELWYVTN